MRLRTRALLVAAITFVAITVLGLQLTYFYSDTRNQVTEVSDSLSPAGTAAAQLASDVPAMERRLRQYVSSGSANYRELFGAARSRSLAAMSRLESYVGHLPEYESSVERVHASLDDWLTQVATPVEKATAGGLRGQAQALLDSAESQNLYTRLTVRTTQLSTKLSEAQDVALRGAADAARRLAWALFTAMLVLLLVPLLNLATMFSSVLSPVSNLRRQLRRTATPGSHDSVIVPDGPPELLELGRDAEALRRELVKEIDSSAAAERALSQESPVVDAIRRELAAQTGEGAPGVTISGIMRPAEGVLAGDFWDRLPLGDGRVALVVCDVSGHGPRAGIVALRLKTTISLGLRSHQELPQILHRACDGFVDEPGRFATVVVIVADPRAGTLEWVNAGHPAPRILRANGTVERLAPTGPMVSWLIGSWTVGTTTLGHHDLALAFTDGILESRDQSGEELGDDGLDERIRSLVAVTDDPGEVTARLLGGIRQRTSDIGRDDVTLVGLRWSHPDAVPPPRSRRTGSAGRTGLQRSRSQPRKPPD